MSLPSLITLFPFLQTVVTVQTLRDTRTLNIIWREYPVPSTASLAPSLTSSSPCSAFPEQDVLYKTKVCLFSTTCIGLSRLSSRFPFPPQPGDFLSHLLGHEG